MNAHADSAQFGPSNVCQAVGGMSRTKSRFSVSSIASSVSSTSSESYEEVSEVDVVPVPRLTRNGEFGRDVHSYTSGEHSPSIDSGLRSVMEPYLRQARLLREKSRNQTLLKVDASIAGSLGVPYIPLRKERCFLFDEHSYPLHSVLAQLLNVQDLTRLHETGANLSPLLEPDRRRAFHLAYDNFVTSFCLPLMHSLAMEKNILHTASSDEITYRFQAFPNFRIATPGQETVMEPVCDTSLGHSMGCLHFHVPLTPAIGSSALYTESHPGREDWHPLTAKAVGVGYLFDGARCLQFEMENATDATAVSLDFRVLIYREFYGKMSHDGGLCPEEMIEDGFSRTDPDYYDEAIVDLDRHTYPGLEVFTKKYGKRLLPPSPLLGAPFFGTM